MRFEEVLLVGKRAFNQQQGGGLLRYEPADRRIHALDYPATPKEWQYAPCYEGPVPDSGWTHWIGCSCRFCTPETSPARGSSTRKAPPGNNANGGPWETG